MSRPRTTIGSRKVYVCTPPSVHKFLIEYASERECSVNAAVLQLLSLAREAVARGAEQRWEIPGVTSPDS